MLAATQTSDAAMLAATQTSDAAMLAATQTSDAAMLAATQTSDAASIFARYLGLPGTLVGSVRYNSAVKSRNLTHLDDEGRAQMEVGLCHKKI
jgi:hypothetical protein